MSVQLQPAVTFGLPQGEGRYAHQQSCPARTEAAWKGVRDEWRGRQTWQKTWAEGSKEPGKWQRSSSDGLVSTWRHIRQWTIIRLQKGMKRRHPTAQMNLENTMLSERSQAQRTTCGVIAFTWDARYREIRGDGKQIGGCQGPGVGEMGSDCLMGLGFILEWGNALELDRGVGCATL